MKLQRNNISTKWFSEGDKGHPIELGEVLKKKPLDPSYLLMFHQGCGIAIEVRFFSGEIQCTFEFVIENNM